MEKLKINEQEMNFNIEEVEQVEAMSEASTWFFAGLGVGVVVGIAAD